MLPPFAVNIAGGLDGQVGQTKEFSFVFSMAKDFPDFIKFISYNYS